MKRLTILLALAVILAACVGGDDTATETFREIGSSQGAPEGVDTAEPAAFAPTEAAVDVEFEATDDRKVIRRASLHIEAGDTRKVFDDIVALTEAAGGFVSDANVFPVEGDDEQPRVNMTLRIPADQLTATMAAIKGSADEVISESQGAQDVTEQFVDLEARLTNLEALEVELRALLEEVRQQPDADPEKLLRVFKEISSVRGQIEQIQGQLDYLDDVVALATLDVQLTPIPLVPPIVDEGWQPMEVARESLTQLVTGLQGIADWGINFAIYTLPLLILILGIPVFAGFFIHKLWRRRSSGTAPEVPAES